MGHDVRQISDALGATFLKELHPSQIPEALTLVMRSQAEAVAAALAPELHYPADAALMRFSEAALTDLLIPAEQSPLELAPLGSVISRMSGMGMGAFAALVGFWGTPVLIIAVPGGMILGGAAEGIAKALNRGLRRRIERLLLGKK